MNDYVEYLIGEQKNENGIILEVLVSGYEQWDFIVAIEGRDDKPFYYDYLVNYLDTDNIWMMDCGGKSTLLAFKAAADKYEWAPRPRILYVCDKDFDDFLNLKEDNVFYTEGYSIESYVATGQYVRYIALKHSRGQITPTELQAIMGKFESEFRRLSSSVTAYCGFMCAVRESGEHPMFDDFGIEHLFDLANGKCVPKPGKQRRAEVALKLVRSPPLKSVRNWARTFSKDDRFGWLRGKLALQLAKKSYEIAKRECAAGLRKKLPDDIRMSREAFSAIRNVISDLPTLKVYCASHKVANAR